MRNNQTAARSRKRYPPSVRLIIHGRGASRYQPNLKTWFVSPTDRPAGLFTCNVGMALAIAALSIRMKLLLTLVHDSGAPFRGGGR